MIPLRGITVFPNMVIHFDVGRDKSIAALEDAMINDQEIFLASQKKAKTESPEEKDIYKVGTVCSIKQLLKLPGETVRVLVEGKYRAKIIKYESNEEFFKVQIEQIEEEILKEEKDMEGILRSVQDAFEEYVKLSSSVSVESLLSLEEIDDPSRFADSIASYLVLKEIGRASCRERV